MYVLQLSKLFSYLKFSEIKGVRITEGLLYCWEGRRKIPVSSTGIWDTDLNGADLVT